MSRLNGGYIGYDAEPTIAAAAPGIWTLREAEFYQRKAQWTINSPPSQVTGLAVDSTGDGTIDLSWSAPASEAAITDYRVEYTPSGGSAAEVLVGSAATSYQLTGLTNDTEYSVRVAAISGGGQGAYSAAVTGTPSAVAVLLISAQDSGAWANEVEIIWTITNPVAQATQYVLYELDYSPGTTRTYNIGAGAVSAFMADVYLSYGLAGEHKFTFNANKDTSASGRAYVEALNSNGDVIASSAETSWSVYDNDD